MTFLNSDGAAVSDIIIVVFLALLTLVCMVALLVFLCKNVDADKPVVHKKIALFCILAAGFVIRLVFGMCIRGYRDDYNIIISMFDDLNRYGVGNYYTGNSAQQLFPIAYFIYLIFGGISNATGLSSFSSVSAQFMVKLPLVIADVLAAFAVYKIAKKYFNERAAYALCAFVCVCPIFFIGSVIWTAPIAFTGMFACFALYYLAKKKYAVMFVFVAAATFSSKEGIYLFPVFAVFSIFHFVRAIIKLRAAKKGEDVDVKSLLKGDCNAVYAVPLGFVLSFIGAYLLGLTMFASYSYNPFVFIYEFVLAPLVSFDNFTYNGLSVYTIFNLNGAVPNTRFPSALFASLFALIITAVVCIIYFTKRNRATMVMLAAYSLFTLAVYYPGAKAIGLSAALILTLVSYAIVKDKRLLAISFVAGLAYVINASCVLACGGFLNNTDNYGIASMSFLMEGGLLAVPITCSVFAVLAHLYFTVTVVSVGMNGTKKMLRQCDGIGASIKEFFARKVD